MQTRIVHLPTQNSSRNILFVHTGLVWVKANWPEILWSLFSLVWEVDFFVCTTATIQLTSQCIWKSLRYHSGMKAQNRNIASFGSCCISLLHQTERVAGAFNPGLMIDHIPSCWNATWCSIPPLLSGRTEFFPIKNDGGMPWCVSRSLKGPGSLAYKRFTSFWSKHCTKP